MKFLSGNHVVMGEETEEEGDEGGEIRLASYYLEDAVKCRNINFIARTPELRLYRIYKSRVLSWLLLISYIVICLLALFEKPSEHRFQLPFWTTVTIELICVTYFLFRFLHETLFIESKAFWRDTKHIALAVILGLVVLDVISCTIMHELGLDYVRWSRPLRPFIIINYPEMRQIRQGFRNIRGTLPDIFNVLFLFFANITLFSLMAYKLFGGTNVSKRNQSPYFQNFLDSFWDLFVLVTTANSPDIMLPSFDRSRGYAAFFVVYLILNLYVFMSVFLAVVYNKFKTNLKNEVRENLNRKKTLLDSAFDLVTKTPEGGLGNENPKMRRAAFFQLLSATNPDYQPEYMQVLAKILDPEDTGAIERKDFYNLVELLSVSYVDIYKEKNIFDLYMPEIYNSTPSRFVRNFVCHKYFRTVFDIIIVLNAVFIAFNIDGGELYFLTLFFLEILFKLYAFGFKAFLSKLWNIFDLVVVGTAIIVTSYQGIIGNGESTIALDFLMILRVIRIFKIFHSLNRFRTVLNTLVNILPSLFTYGGILFIVYYFFAIIGMELFHGKIHTNYGSDNCGNSKLTGSEFADHNYCHCNFNDLSSAMVLLFQLMLVNQWHVITSGHVAVTSEWAKLFFLAFHIMCIIIVLNIFIAFILEAFMLEYSLSRLRIHSDLLGKIKSMGLLYAKGKGNVAVRAADEGLILHGDGGENPVDADHEEVQVDEKYDLEGVECSHSRDLSNQTSIRFVISRKSRSVQELLEKMFEKEL